MLMQNPDTLRVSAEAEKLANAIYDYTRRFPREEIFGLVAQMRKAAVSVGSNIFEACGRQGNRENESNASARSFITIHTARRLSSCFNYASRDTSEWATPPRPRRSKSNSISFDANCAG